MNAFYLLSSLLNVTFIIQLIEDTVKRWNVKF